MSKETATFEVIDNALIERRALEQAWAAVRQAEAQLAVAEGEAQAAARQIGVTYVAVMHLALAPRADAPRAEVDAYLSRLRARTAAVVEHQSRAEATRQLRDLISKNAAGGSPPPRAADSTATEGANRRETVERILGRLSPLAPLSETAAASDAAELFLREASSNIAHLKNRELALRRCVQRANELAAQRLADAAAAEQLLDTARGLDDERLGDLLAQLCEVIALRRPLSQELREDVGRAMARARAKADAEYAAMVLREELERLGYVVDDVPPSPAATSAVALYRHATLGNDYRLAVELDASASSLHAEIIRQAPHADDTSREQMRRDQEAEARGCEDLAALRRAAQRRSVAMDLVHRVPAGAEPLLSIGQRAASRDRMRRDKLGARAKER